MSHYVLITKLILISILYIINTESKHVVVVFETLKILGGEIINSKIPGWILTVYLPPLGQI